jgi:hypothetical protein
MGSGSSSILRGRVSVEITVDYPKFKPCLTTSGVTTIKENIMIKKQTNTNDIKTKASLTSPLRKKLITLIAVVSLVFCFDGGMAPSAA